MKTESVIVLPVVARETVYLDWSILDASGEEIARQILFLKQAHTIARALNTQPQLLEACQAAIDELTHCVKTASSGTEKANRIEVITQLQTAITAAEKEKV